MENVPNFRNTFKEILAVHDLFIYFSPDVMRKYFLLISIKVSLKPASVSTVEELQYFTMTGA